MKPLEKTNQKIAAFFFFFVFFWDSFQFAQIAHHFSRHGGLMPASPELFHRRNRSRNFAGNCVLRRVVQVLPQLGGLKMSSNFEWNIESFFKGSFSLFLEATSKLAEKSRSSKNGPIFDELPTALWDLTSAACLLHRGRT